MHLVHAPHLGRSVVLGGRTRPSNLGARKHLKFGDYAGKLRVPAALPLAPDTYAFLDAARASLSQLYLNDQLGCCVIAGGYHVIGTALGNAGSPVFVATDAQIKADYHAIGGYVDGDSSTDNGCDEDTALSYWSTTGFADGSKLAAYVAVDPTCEEEVQQACWLFGNLFFGIELPDSWTAAMPEADGFIWNNDTPDPRQGHCVAGVGYDAVGVQIATWGLVGTITYDAVASLCSASDGGQLFTLLTPDQLVAGQQKASNGFDWSQLQADIGALKSV
jgi:hypothetical protein